ncbi:hypothetical protein [Altererythrobacter sp.]|uniref:hypothetical protein n=1 Tax=Altererythrobacter sp. TaxID=1872480 RepID=UPI003D030703
MQWKPLITIAILAAASSPAVAQLAPPEAPAPGTVDGAAAARGNREQLEGYNRVVNQGVKVSNADDERRDKRNKKGPQLAGAADFTAGATVRDKYGVHIATIEAIDETGVIVKSDMRLAKLPQEAFGKDDAGLMLGISAHEFRAAIAETSVPVAEEPKIVEATVADMVNGAPVRDSEGVEFGKIDRLVENGVVMDMDGRKVRLKLKSFAKDEEGLMIGITASELKALLPE